MHAICALLRPFFLPFLSLPRFPMCAFYVTLFVPSSLHLHLHLPCIPFFIFLFSAFALRASDYSFLSEVFLLSGIFIILCSRRFTSPLTIHSSSSFIFMFAFTSSDLLFSVPFLPLQFQPSFFSFFSVYFPKSLHFHFNAHFLGRHGLGVIAIATIANFLPFLILLFLPSPFLVGFTRMYSLIISPSIALHFDKTRTSKRLKLFWSVLGGTVVYELLPQYMWVSLSIFGLWCSLLFSRFSDFRSSLPSSYLFLYIPGQPSSNLPPPTAF
jgi:hypothetical protein